jgi:hypothetical protein
MRESIATPRQPSRGLKRFGKLTLFQGDSGIRESLRAVREVDNVADR